MTTTVDQVKTFVETLTGYRIQDDGLLRDAINATSNKRLALVGDIVHRQALVDDWYPSGGSTDTANHTLQRLATNANYHMYALRVGLGNHIIVNSAQRGQPPSPRSLYDTVEALIGAIWLDSGKDLNVLKAALTTMQLL